MYDTSNIYHNIIYSNHVYQIKIMLPKDSEKN
jgi:hypothetical protein